MRKLLPLLFLLPQFAIGAVVSGVVRDDKGNPLPYASIIIKGTAKGTTANNRGVYSLPVGAGEHILLCQHIGYASVEKKLTLSQGDIQVDFVLAEQKYNLQNVEVRSGAEDPAYEIIRKTIKKRVEHLGELKHFQCEVYIKGQLQLRDYPKRFMGEKVDFEDADTSKRKMLLLSETFAKYSVNGRDQQKVEVISTRVSGQSQGFGFSDPQIISFYENNISIGQGLNPRGFISPISDNALNFYKYHFEGSFYENGKEISRIKVIPRRTYEPLFTGYINIIEDEWRLQSVQLTLLREQQMQFLDTLRIEQLYVPIGNAWVIKQQVIYPAGKIFGFDFFGNFLQVYDKFELEPKFERKSFNNTLIRFFDSSNKHTPQYWDSVRPIPLLPAEARDYVRKDSLAQVRKSPRYTDSIDRKNNKVTVMKLMVTGLNFHNEKKNENLSFDPLLKAFDSYNTVEGYVVSLGAHYTRRIGEHRLFSLNPTVRYGFGNKIFNAYATGSINLGGKYNSNISFGGGKRSFQFNNADPISALNNSIATLFYTHNLMKLYQANFARVAYSKGLGDGFNINIATEWQDRFGLSNTSDTKLSTVADRSFSPNPGLGNGSRALSATLGIVWRPGGKYIEFPDRKIGLGSRYPVFNVAITQGIHGWLGSDADYTRWRFVMSDNLNLKLGGRFNYRLEAGGFLNSNAVANPDLQHFMGDQTAIAANYLSGFQLLPYYALSTFSDFYATGHAEYHLNGLLTNKIPGFRKLNWFLVVGGNALYIKPGIHYYEAMLSLENIFKVLRVDFVKSFPPPEVGGVSTMGIRFSTPLIR